MRSGARGHDLRSRPAAALVLLLGLAGLLAAGLFFLRSGPARETPAARVPGAGDMAHPAEEVEPIARLQEAAPETAPANPPGAEQIAPATGVEPARAETALVFRVVDGASGEPLETFEARLGQRYLRPLLDEAGRTRQRFPGGVARFPGLVESGAGENVTLAILARGFEELRVPDLYVSPGRELDLGTLRLARAPRLHVLVLDDVTGRAVAGARVVLLAEGAALEPDARPVLSGSLDPFRARTEGDGRVLLGSRPGERARLAVRHDDYAPFDLELSLPLSREHAETVRLRPPAKD